MTAIDVEVIMRHSFSNSFLYRFHVITHTDFVDTFNRTVRLPSLQSDRSMVMPSRLEMIAYLLNSVIWMAAGSPQTDDGNLRFIVRTPVVSKKAATDVDCTGTEHNPAPPPQLHPTLFAIA